METSLHSASLTADELSQTYVTHQDADMGLEEEEHHIHLPNPSFWPLVLSIAILVTVAGLLFIPSNFWISLIAAPFVLIGIMGWALEDPMAAPKGTETSNQSLSHRIPPPPARVVLDQANQVVERTVTFGSTAYSAHPVKVEIEDEGVILALYGKVELEAQRNEIEEEVRKLPGVLDVRNFIIAEDSILRIANARLESLREKGKLDGARNLSILVENYILSLYGEVPTSDMKFALEREMIGIPGVRVVINHIGLNKEIPGNLGKTRNKI